MTRQQLERRQVWVYLAAILMGLAVGFLLPRLAAAVAAAVWPALGLLLYATFTQVPLAGLAGALRDRRFMAAVLAGNFLLVPLLVWALVALLPPDPALRLGVILVLLMPCTDWYVTFTHLAGGDTGRAIAVTPLNLLAQIGLLPVYLWLFMGDAALPVLAADRVMLVFSTLILLPLVAAWATGRWAAGRDGGALLIGRLGWLPVPLLALILFLVAASQVEAVAQVLPRMGPAAAVFALYLVAAALLGLGIARLLRLAPAAGTALVFGLGTRNSFLVLPLALALGPAWTAAAVAIVVQSLVELFGMLAYLRLVPRLMRHRWVPGD